MKIQQYLLSLSAGAAALLALSACQSQESPTGSKAMDTEVPGAPAARPMPEGRKATDAEVARILADRKDMPAMEMPEGKAPLAHLALGPEHAADGSPAARPLGKAAALPTCVVNFAETWGLDVMPDEAYDGYAKSPYYTHPCNANYFVFSKPLQNIDNVYRLIPEASNWCVGTPNRIGKWINNSCQQQNSAIYWPRRAGNMGGNTGVRFNVKNQFNTPKNFDLQAIYIHSGTAEVVAYRPGIGWWVWYPLSGGQRWYWPAGTVVSEIQVYDHGRNGTIYFDNIEIAINP